MKRMSTILAVVLVVAIAAPVFADKRDTVRTGAPVPPTMDASEVYPVTYAGGPAPSPVLGELDADDSTYNRVVGCGSLSGVGTAVYYDTIQFTNTGLNEATVVAFVSSQGNPAACPFDSTVTVYSSFNPADPLAGCVTYNDDAIGVCSQVTFPLPAGATYTIVISSYGNGTTGLYQINFDGTTPVELQSFSVE